MKASLVQASISHVFDSSYMTAVKFDSLSIVWQHDLTRHSESLWFSICEILMVILWQLSILSMTAVNFDKSKLKDIGSESALMKLTDRRHKWILHFICFLYLKCTKMNLSNWDQFISYLLEAFSRLNTLVGLSLWCH